MRIHWLAAIAILGLSFGAAYWVGMAARSAQQPPQMDVIDGLAVSTAILDLGEVVAGGRKECEFCLTNPSDSPVEIAKIETSCDCLRIDVSSRIIPPAQTAVGCAVFNLRKEPHFTGKLGIEVRGKDRAEKILFALEVKVAVNSE
jgi:hypothetical protein